MSAALATAEAALPDDQPIIARHGDDHVFHGDPEADLPVCFAGPGDDRRCAIKRVEVLRGSRAGAAAAASPHSS